MRDAGIRGNDTHQHLYDDVDAAGERTPLRMTQPSRLTYSKLDLISWSWQIAKGMGHLANKKVRIISLNIILTTQKRQLLYCVLGGARRSRRA